MSLIRSFLFNSSGNFAVIGALLSVPLILAAGVAVDYARYSASNRHLQELTDMAALSMATSKEQNTDKLAALAMDIIESSRDPDRVENVRILTLKASADDVDLSLEGDIPTTFMSMSGYDRLRSQTSALAERAVNGRVEVALILDNTWSMSETDAKGDSKIDILKKAATALVDELMKVEDGAVRIGLVPYADYVNVGTGNRNAGWLDVPDDYTKPGKPRECVTLDTKQVCEKRAPKKTCTRVVDGVSETYQCGGGCTSYKTVAVKPYQSCTGGGKGTDYTWHGCVGSRRKLDNRLHNNYPSDKYPGYVDNRYRCPNPITQLTADKKMLLGAIDDMVINRGTYYRPLTYIPAGLIWGLNVLSPGEPFSGAAPFDADNRKPRKVAILMTDGENTLRFRKNNGKHTAFGGGAKNVLTQLGVTNSDTEAICSNMKVAGIEVFSIAFMVDDASAKSVLENCASDAGHYYDADDGAALLSAFSGIGASLRVVRLAR